MNNEFDQLPNVPIRTFELDVKVTGGIEGSLPDWPAEIQDAIWEALEAKAKEVRLPLTIIYSECKFFPGDDGLGVNNQDGTACWHIHCIASEIVVRDMRFSSEEMMKKVYDEIVATRAH